jgi:hypothetical protein
MFDMKSFQLLTPAAFFLSILAVPASGQVDPVFTNSVTIDGASTDLNLNNSTPQDWTIRSNSTGLSFRRGGTIPLLLNPSAGASAIYVDADADTALGTITPNNDFNSRLHIEDQTPDIAFKTIPGGDILAQTWSLFANDVGFGVCDETAYPQSGDPVNGVPCTPFFVQAASPPDSLVIRDSGNVGVNTIEPAVKLHVVDDTDAQVRVQNTADAVGFNTKVMFNLINDGGVRFDMLDNSTGNNWVFQNQFGTFDVTLAGTGTREFRFNPNGNLEISGTLISASSRTLKNNIVPVDPQSVLERVLKLPINEWSYNAEGEVRHMGPISEDFYEIFKLGGTDKGLSSVDPAGVALAAIQGMNQELMKRDQRIEQLERSNAMLISKLEELESLRSMVKEVLLRDTVASN